MKKLIKKIQNKNIQLFVVGIVVILAYINIFQNQFVIDDETFINWEGHKISNLGNLLAGELPPGQEGTYRPIRSLLYTLYHYLWGANPFGYHLHSLLVITASTILVYLILKKIFKKSLPALVGSLIFGLHPIHVESITYISASMETAGAAFFFLSFYLYLRARERKKFSMLSILFAALAFFTYEMTLTLPILILLYEFLFRVKTKPHAINPIPLLYFLPAGFYLFLRFIVLDITGKGTYASESIYINVILGIKVLAKYINLTLWPFPQIHNHMVSEGVEAILYRGHAKEGIASQPFFSPETFVSVSVVLLAVSLAIWSLKKHKEAAFGIFWFFITIVPALNFLPQGSLLHEKFLFIPSLGFSLAFGSIFCLLWQKKEKLTNFLFVVLLSVFLLLTSLQNSVWRHEPMLWSTDILRSQDSFGNSQNAYAHFQLGNYHFKKENFESAINEYQKAFDINPNFAIAAASIARANINQGEQNKAITNYNKATQADPFFWEAYRELGKIYVEQDKFTKAVENFQKSLIIKPNSQDTLDQLNVFINEEKNWIEQTINEVSFKYPKDWQAQGKNPLQLSYEGFSVNISAQRLVNREAYILSSSQREGEIISKGLAKIPNVEYAYLNVWQKDDKHELQFFLFGKNQVLEVVTSPVNSSLMFLLDHILASIRFI